MPIFARMVFIGAMVALIGCEPSKINSGKTEERALLPTDLLPADGATTDVMTLVSPARVTELETKLHRAAAADPQWWTEHVKKAEPGKPLAYDARLGMTEHEYAELLHLYNELTFAKTNTRKVSVRRTGDQIEIGFGGRPQNIMLDLNADRVTTPFGTTQTHTKVLASDSQKTTGRWNGFSWRFEESNPSLTAGTTIEFGLGKLESTGRAFLHYEVNRVASDSTTSFLLHLQYEMQAPP